MRHEQLDHIPQVHLLADDCSRCTCSGAPGLGKWPSADVARFCSCRRRRGRRGCLHSTCATPVHLAPASTSLTDGHRQQIRSACRRCPPSPGLGRTECSAQTVSSGRSAARDSAICAHLLPEDGDVPGSLEVAPCHRGRVGLRGRDSWEPLAWAADRRKARRFAAARLAVVSGHLRASVARLQRPYPHGDRRSTRLGGAR